MIPCILVFLELLLDILLFLEIDHSDGLAPRRSIYSTSDNDFIKIITEKRKINK